MKNYDIASSQTALAHKEACCNPVFNWQDRQDFDFASRGLIHRPNDPDIKDDDGNIVWHHEEFEAFLHGNASETVHPSLWRHALLNNYRGLFKVCEGVWQVRGESLGNATFIETETGYICIDPLTTAETARYALNLLYEHVGRRPIVGMIYSHTHSDHFGGVKGMISDEDVAEGRCVVVASEGFTEWVLKEQGLAAEGMPSRNDYMYGENLEVSATGIVDTGLGQMIEGGEVTYIEPTHVIDKNGGKMTIDGVEIEFMFAPGEAPTGMHCYFPKHKLQHCADNCYMCLHNVYTIRGAFPRDAMQWADSVARSLLFEDTEYLVSGHNWPVFGGDNIRKFLGEQRDGIKFMHDQTLRMMSHGFVPSEIANEIEFPPSLARLWHLRGYYGSLKHNVRGIYAYYLGWYDGNPATLDSLPPRDQARRTLDYMGGVDAVLSRAKADFEAGEYRWVTHIVDQVIWAEPNNMVARELAAAAHTQMGYGSENPTWRNAYLSAANELRYGLPQGEKNHRVLRDVLKGMGPLLLMNSLSIRLNGPKAAGLSFVINWKIVGTNESCHTELSNAVLNNRDGLDPTANLTVTLPRLMLSEFALGQIGLDEISGEGVSMIGDPSRLAELASLLDSFPAWFPIATHDQKFGESNL
jgi:alkyl sulfatase BDS1-like metallo-beta-lactamase superfamily hydrolase